MPTLRHTTLALCGVLSLIASFASHANAPDAATLQKLIRATVPFVANAGQWDARAAFAAQTFAGTVFVTQKGELIYSLPGKPIPDDTSPADAPPQPRHGHAGAVEKRGPGWALSESFVDRNNKPLPATAQGFRPQTAQVSYFIGNDEAKHQRGLNTYERVNLGDIYPGINVQVRATGNNIEKIFTVAPKQDPQQIQVKLSGVTRLEINAKGELIAHTGNGPVAYTAPIAFQEDGQGRQQPVTVAYALDAAHNTYGFTLAAYDDTRALIIDPLIKSSYLGAAGFDQVNALAIHPATGEVYVAGYTASATPSFPGVSGSAQGGYGGGTYDAFVSRFSADLTLLIKSSYLGASGYDAATALAIHPATGEVYVVGYTDATTTSFPGVSGGAQGSIGGGGDAFVSRFSADLTLLIKSSYLGAAGYDQATALAIHPATGEVYVAGYTNSGTTTFPGVSGGAQGSYGGGAYDAFVSRFSADLTTLIKSSYLGATGTEQASALAIHPATGEVYVAGYTTSTTTSFPGVGGGAQGSYGGGYDAFVSRFSADLNTLIKSSYLGAAGYDQATALAIHPATGEVYVAGYTDATTTSFPGVSGGAQGSTGGGGDAFVSRFSADLTTLIKSSYLGAAGYDQANALTIHPATGEVYVAGYTASATPSFPGVSGGAQSSYGGGADAFVSRFSADLTTLIKSSYLGAAGGEIANALAIHPTTGEIYVAGYTNSATTSFPGVIGGAQSSFGGSYDAFVSRFSADLTMNDTTPNAYSFITQANVPINSLRTSNPVLVTGIVGPANIYVDGAFGSKYCISSGNDCSCDVSGAFVSTPGTITNNSYVCARHNAASATNVLTQTNVHIGGAVGQFFVTTGTAISTTACNLDMDGDTLLTATKEWLVLLRASLGFTGTSTTAGTGISAAQWTAARPLINANCGTNFGP